MTLSHKQGDPIKPARVVVLGAGGFLGRRTLMACAAAGVETAGLSSRDLDLTGPAAGAQLAHLVKSLIGISAEVRVVQSGGIERSIGKAKRVVDKRPRG